MFRRFTATLLSVAMVASCLVPAAYAEDLAPEATAAPQEVAAEATPAPAETTPAPVAEETPAPAPAETPAPVEETPTPTPAETPAPAEETPAPEETTVEVTPDSVDATTYPEATVTYTYEKKTDYSGKEYIQITDFTRTDSSEGKVQLTYPSELDGTPVTRINAYPNHAFDERNSNIARVILPEGIDTYYCDVWRLYRNVEEVVLPSTLLYVSNSDFNEEVLKRFTVTSGGEFSTTADGKYLLKDGGRTLAGVAAEGLTKVEVPAGVTKIDAAISSLSAVEEVVLPNSLKIIGDISIENMMELKSITIPGTVTSIGYRSFNGTGLTSIDLSAAVTEVGEYTFGSSPYLTDITIRNPYMKIGDGAFKVDVLNPTTVTVHGYTGSTAETMANAFGYTFVSLGAINPVWNEIKEYAGKPLFNSMSDTPRSSLCEVALDKYSNKFFMGEQVGNTLVYYQRFLDGSATSQDPDLTGTLTVRVRANSGNVNFEEEYAGTRVPDPLAQKFCTALGLTGTSYALKYEVPIKDGTLTDYGDILLNGAETDCKYGYKSASFPQDSSETIIPVDEMGLPFTNESGYTSWTAFGSPSSMVDITAVEINTYMNSQLVVDQNRLAAPAEFNCKVAYTPDAGYENYKPVAECNVRNNLWTVSFRAVKPTQGTATITLTSLKDGTVYTLTKHISFSIPVVGLYSDTTTPQAQAYPATYLYVAGNVNMPSTYYLRGAEGLSAAQLDPDNWTIKGCNYSVASIGNALPDETVTPAAGHQAKCLELNLVHSARYTSGRMSDDITVKDNSTGKELKLHISVQPSASSVSFRTDTFGLTTGRDAALMDDGHYVTPDTATPGVSGFRYGGFGDINLRLGEVLKIGAQLTNKAVEGLLSAGWSAWNTFASDPWVWVKSATATSKDAAKLTVTANTDDENYQGSIYTAKAPGNTTVTYTVTDANYNGGRVTADVEQTVHVVGDLNSMSMNLSGMPTKNIGGKTVVQMNLGDSVTLSAPNFSWKNGVKGLENYRYYKTASDDVATIETVGGTEKLVAKGCGRFTLLVESTATRSNVEGCNWERLYADADGYAKYATVEVYVVANNISGLEDDGSYGTYVSAALTTDQPVISKLGTTTTLKVKPVTLDGKAPAADWDVTWEYSGDTDVLTVDTAHPTGTHHESVAIKGIAGEKEQSVTAVLKCGGTEVARKTFLVANRLNGDCAANDNKVDVLDALAVAQTLNDKRTTPLSSDNVWLADANTNGTVDRPDFALVCDYAAGLKDPAQG